MSALETPTSPTREIRVTNTLTRKKERFETIEPGVVRMYACGVTTYDHCHVGHALQAVFFDVIRRYLEYVGYQVVYVRNFTDVDDKVIQRAKERGMKPEELSEQMVQAAREEMALLGILPATHEPRVSESIPQIIAMVEKLVENGSAYATADGDVYYRVREKDDYGKLSGRKIDELRSGTRDLVHGQKEFELDFALWKADETPGASWTSPWGMGRPGWHIECSAMALEFLGPSFDIHGGGRDLVFPHHENEIAQSESANGTSFARYWLHNGLLTIEKQKMSKSLGNHLLITDAVKRWPREVLRLSIMSMHYTSNVDFSEQAFQSWFERLYYYYSTLALLQEASAGVEIPAGESPDPKSVVESFDPGELRESFHRAMSDDFNTAAALAELNVHLKRANDFLTGKHDKAKRKATAAGWVTVIREIAQVLGILEEAPEVALESLKEQLLPQLQITREEIEREIEARKMARDNRDFAESDTIRDRLATRGIELRDGRDGTTWAIRLSRIEQ